jgi:hypothetical protein
MMTSDLKRKHRMRTHRYAAGLSPGAMVLLSVSLVGVLCGSVAHASPGEDVYMAMHAAQAFHGPMDSNGCSFVALDVAAVVRGSGAGFPFTLADAGKVVVLSLAVPRDVNECTVQQASPSEHVMAGIHLRASNFELQGQVPQKGFDPWHVALGKARIAQQPQAGSLGLAPVVAGLIETIGDEKSAERTVLAAVARLKDANDLGLYRRALAIDDEHLTNCGDPNGAAERAILMLMRLSMRTSPEPITYFESRWGTVFIQPQSRNGLGGSFDVYVFDIVGQETFHAEVRATTAVEDEDLFRFVTGLFPPA